ncbi:Ras-specific guanine nucleotide-releasing factor 2 [Exaiptasia diaphana]|nr:Ras-specific guanine nucleotide-releasing factor 2 [Exaiptasia diaphana]
MRSSARICEEQILYLGSLARQYYTLKGQLYIKASDTGKWHLKWAALYQNFIFMFESEDSAKVTGVILLEHSSCEHTCLVNAKDSENQNCFTIYVPLGDNLKQMITLRASTDKQCTAWIESIRQSSFSEIKSTMNELDEKYNHLLQVMESEKTAKWKLMEHCDDQAEIIAILRAEIVTLRQKKAEVAKEEESEEIKSIKKVQSMVRGWLCRRRWHNIVQDYIRSPHAESMRKRNSICFQLVETEEEYLDNLSTLVSCFYRPFKMAASSKRPPLSHEEVNSIFLNSETILFLHQIFLKGLNTRMESWPTLILGDLFDMLLPMLSIYQEYVRNHHYSLQTLTECKQRAAFNRLLKLYEEKPICEGRTLETFLTYPMHRQNML